MTEIEVALAVSARVWPDRLHRFLADHGGARVRAQVLTPEDALAEEYAVLIIDDVSSFLTPRLVQELQRRRRLVLGVFDPADGQDGKERLRECGVDQVIESDADADEFLIALRALVTLAPGAPIDDPIDVAITGSGGRLIVVGSPPGGCGATEVAIAIATRLGRSARTVVIDFDEVAPAIAQRLGLPLLPNLRSAIDVVQHRRGDLANCLRSAGPMEVLSGLSSDRDWMDIRPLEVHDVIEELRHEFTYMVANVAPLLEQVGFGESGRFGISRSVTGVADQIIGVGLGHPVAISRLIQWTHQVRDLNSKAPFTLVVNRAPRSPFKRAEIGEELGRATGVPVRFLPTDPRIETAAWDGEPVSAGRFAGAVARFTDRVMV